MVGMCGGLSSFEGHRSSNKRDLLKGLPVTVFWESLKIVPLSPFKYTLLNLQKTSVNLGNLLDGKRTKITFFYINNLQDEILMLFKLVNCIESTQFLESGNYYTNNNSENNNVGILGFLETSDSGRNFYIQENNRRERQERKKAEIDKRQTDK